MKESATSRFIPALFLTLLFLNASAASCSNGTEYHTTIIQENNKVSYEKVVKGLRVPWGMVFLPNGDMLITERNGEIRRVINWQLAKEPISGVPKVYQRGQGGLLDIELHPNFVDNQILYLSYSSSEGEGNGGHTAIMRAKLEGNSLVDQEVLYKAEPNTTSSAHFGSRLEFDKEGYLYFSIGDRRNRDVNPQDITRDGGKIYRIHDDGRIPDDNPFVSRNGAKAAIFSYGHRNPQGMAMNPATGDIWIHEHGPQGGDEVNLIGAGKNYGWPIISYGVNYGGGKFAKGTSRAGMEQPLIHWTPSIAPSGMTFITGNKYPGWAGHMIAGSLKFNYLVLCKIERDRIISQEIIAKGIGRVRNVRQGPDGYLYVAVENKGIYRLTMDD